MDASRSKTLAAAILLSFAAVILLCALSASAMNSDGAMNNCSPHDKGIALCTSSPQAHILAWQKFLSVIPQQGVYALLTSLLLAAALFTIRGRLQVAPRLRSVQRWMTSLRKDFAIIDPIRRALSRGIIEPQIYNFTNG